MRLPPPSRGSGLSGCDPLSGEGGRGADRVALGLVLAVVRLELVAAHRAGVCVGEPRRQAPPVENVLAGHLSDTLAGLVVLRADDARLVLAVQLQEAQGGANQAQLSEATAMTKFCILLPSS